MLSDDIKIGDKLKISTKLGTYFRQSFTSRVDDILGHHLLLVYTPIANGSYVELPKGNDYLFLFYTKSGLVQAPGTVLEHCVQNGIDFMKIEFYECQRIQRRRFFRLDYILDFTFTRTTDLSDDTSPDDMPIYRGIIKNLSGGGLHFVSDLELSLSEHLLSYLTLNDNVITVQGKVRHIQPPNDSIDKYEYRLEFIDIESAQQEQIIQYVFHKQREMIKKMRMESE